MNIRKLVDSSDTRAGRIFDWIIQTAIIVSILSMTVETMPNLYPWVYKLLNGIEIVSVVIFTIELLLRLFFSEKGFRYLLTFYGWVDVLAILPFYLSLGVDLRGLRAFRLLRIFRLLKLARYSTAIRRYTIALKKAKEELILFGATALIIIFLSAVGIHIFESETQPDKFGSIPQCIWWAVSTLTTVGYGDVYPITSGGKAFTLLILTVGLAAVAVPTGIIASALTEARDQPLPPESSPPADEDPPSS